MNKKAAIYLILVIAVFAFLLANENKIGVSKSALEMIAPRPFQE